MSDLSESMVNPYAPPKPSASTSTPSEARSHRSILGTLFVLPALFAGVILVFVSPSLGLVLLVLMHIIDRRLFHGPPFLSQATPKRTDITIIGLRP